MQKDQSMKLISRRKAISGLLTTGAVLSAGLFATPSAFASSHVVLDQPTVTKFKATMKTSQITLKHVKVSGKTSMLRPKHIRSRQIRRLHCFLLKMRRPPSPLIRSKQRLILLLEKL
jgi:hypothetical protein